MTYWGAQTPSAADADWCRRRGSSRLSCDVCKVGGLVESSMVGLGGMLVLFYRFSCECASCSLVSYAAQGDVRSVDSVDVVLERHSWVASMTFPTPCARSAWTGTRIRTYTRKLAHIHIHTRTHTLARPHARTHTIRVWTSEWCIALSPRWLTGWSSVPVVNGYGSLSSATITQPCVRVL